MGVALIAGHSSASLCPSCRAKVRGTAMQLTLGVPQSQEPRSLAETAPASP